MRQLKIYILVVIIALLQGAAVTAYAYTNAQYASWGYRPIYSTSASTSFSTQQTTGNNAYCHSYTPACRKISAFDSQFGNGAQLSSYFPYIPADTRLTTFKGRTSTSSNPWDDDYDDDENGVGEVDDEAPIGEPFILLMLAMLYLAKVLIQRRKERGCYQ